MVGKVRKVSIGDVKNGMSYTVGGRAAGFTITEIAVDPAYYDKYGVWTVGVWVQTDGDCSELWKTFPLGNCFLEYTLDL